MFFYLLLKEFYFPLQQYRTMPANQLTDEVYTGTEALKLPPFRGVSCWIFSTLTVPVFDIFPSQLAMTTLVNLSKSCQMKMTLCAYSVFQRTFF